jgi:LuxR family maltose regulon positive regulatory protein
MQRKLTLISAPAGFGKTTLVSEWRATSDRKAAWLSLDESDSDLTRFLTYLLAALRTVAPGIGDGISDVLQSPQPPPADAILTALLNEIDTIPADFVLVLDDYHVIDNRAIDNALAFLLEHLPQQMHLIITTREDPQLPLARLRARGQLTELRAADLRFTPSEAANFLNLEMGLNLSTGDIDALEKRTEGWIAGLQLVAISLQGHPDAPGFIRAFAGDHRYIVDYLVEEVLQHQSESVRGFLLQTSILERLNGPLCDAVTGQPKGKSQAQLEALERGNFFVVPLDDRRYWYRYHHLFGEVLYARLVVEAVEAVEAVEQPDQVTTLHRRASEWYERNGFMVDTMNHALAAHDFEHAADVFERAVPALRSSRQDALFRGWLKALPDELFHARPVLSVWYAHVLLASGDLEEVEEHLRDAERWLEIPHPSDTPGPPSDQGAPRGPHARPAGMVVVDEEAFRGLPGTIAIARAGQAMALGDVAGTVKYARRVLEVAPADDHASRGGATAYLGLASWLSGDLEAAHHSFADGIAHLQMAGFTADAIGGAITLADIRIAQGRLHDAMRTYEHGLQLATRHTEQGEQALRGTADMHVGMGAILHERNDLDGAMWHLMRSKELGEHTGFPQNRYRWHVAMSRILAAQGDLDGALERLGEAEHLYISGLVPNVRPVAALKARVWVAQASNGTPGSLAEAARWAREQGLSAGDELSYMREFEQITLVRVLLAQYKVEKQGGADGSIREAMGLLARLLQAAEEGGRTGSVIEILVLQALAHRMQGGIDAALVSLQRALALAEPEGYVRIFVDEGMPMALLLREVAKHGVSPSYVRQLLKATGSAEDQDGQDRAPVKQDLVEPLSERELEVLRLLQTPLSGPEIAQALTVSLNTIHTHTKNIYTKLGVNSRRAAVDRAEELHLI